MIQVAAYCRVSTDQADQVNSLAAQRRYFAEYISRQPDWELYDIYADEGISGTGTKKRAAFNRMIRDAREGRFQLILTKEVSRFSRNILDTISYTRELRSRGIGVLFVTDGICTLDADAELRLSIMASLAQEESRKTSARVKWGQMRQMERGVVFGHGLLGYTVKNGKLSIKEDQAQLVRRIFRLYVEEGRTSGEIAALLRSEGVQKPHGDTDWSSRYILRILKNEKYTGDLVQKKSYTPDYLNHAKKRNCGEEEIIIQRDHHEAIVSRTLWDAVQEEILCRDTRKRKTASIPNRSGLTGKICCGECGAAFVRRQKQLGDGSMLRRWSCGRVVRHGADPSRGGCAVGRLLREDDVMNMLRQALCSLDIDRCLVAEQTATIVLQALRAEDERTQEKLGQWHREEKKMLLKKEAVLDAWLAGEIEKNEMQQMKLRYDTALKDLHGQINSVKYKTSTDCENKELNGIIADEIRSLLYDAENSGVLAECLLAQLTVFRDRHLELRLKGLDMVFRLE